MSPNWLDLEGLAAFIDGRLKARERSRVVRLLCESETAYEVFAETLRFQAEGGQGVRSQSDRCQVAGRSEEALGRQFHSSPFR
jgi:hypothetical protein